MTDTRQIDGVTDAAAARAAAARLAARHGVPALERARLAATLGARLRQCLAEGGTWRLTLGVRGADSGGGALHAVLEPSPDASSAGEGTRWETTVPLPAADRPRDGHRDTTQDPGGGRRIRRSGVRSPTGAEALPRRCPDHPGDADLLPALSAAPPPGRLRCADPAVGRRVAAPQREVPHPDHPGRCHRRGSEGQGLRRPQHHRPDRQRAVRLHRADPRQRPPVPSTSPGSRSTRSA
ncbi:hypothetical protein SHIRM173S_01325 [Streptomyces hirsutus]